MREIGERLRRWSKRHLFSSRSRTLATAFEFLGALGGIFTTLELLRWISAKIAFRPPIEITYVWATFGTMLVCSALLIALVSSADWHLARERARGDRGPEVLHEAIEEARRAVVAGAEPNWSRIVGRLRDYVRETTGIEACVTVKFIVRRQQLKTVFRVGADHGRSACGGFMPAKESLVYGLLTASSDDGSNFRQVVVRDTHALGTTQRDYIDLSKRCGYRSVLAFPLRGPSETFALGSVSAKKNHLYGFLAIDAPDPGAFNELFDQNWREHDWSLQKVKPLRPLDVFYGFADAAATILLAQERNKDHSTPLPPAGERQETPV